MDGSGGVIAYLPPDLAVSCSISIFSEEKLLMLPRLIGNKLDACIVDRVIKPN